jgi:hypothetical protein
MSPSTAVTSPFSPNLGNSVFPGLNDAGGILLCGYEWGLSKADQAALKQNGELNQNRDATHTFSDKTPRFGDQARSWRYDERIRRWFSLWGHPLSDTGKGGVLEQSIMQTNWCNTQAPAITGRCLAKLLDPLQVRNFVDHLAYLRPRLVLLFGSVMAQAMGSKTVSPLIENVLGPRVGAPIRTRKDFPGKRFWVTFQRFEAATIVCLPHPSSSWGLQEDYISLFAGEMSPLIDEIHKEKARAPC